MITKLENELITAEIDSYGAELTSLKLKEENLDYLWSGDREFWGRQSPILFPIVGKVKDNTYRVEGKEYTLKQHGFARNCDYELITNNDSQVTYRLTSNSSTLENYPYQFQLDVNYSLEGNQLKIEHRVKNTDTKEIYFSLGAHPGFNCPLFADEQMEDYYLEFEREETANTILVEGSLISDQTKQVLDQEKKINLAPDLFAENALIFKNLKSDYLSIKGKKHEHQITVNFSEFPYLAIWSPAKRSPFVCIEPWHGLPDSINTNQKLKDKEGVISLKPQAEFSCSYTISIK